MMVSLCHCTILFDAQSHNRYYQFPVRIIKILYNVSPQLISTNNIHWHSELNFLLVFNAFELTPSLYWKYQFIITGEQPIKFSPRWFGLRSNTMGVPRENFPVDLPDYHPESWMRDVNFKTNIIIMGKT